MNIGFLDAQVGEQDGAGVDSRNLAVGRVSLNVLEESSVGVIGTFGDPNSNREAGLVGFDVNYRTSKLFGDKRFVANLWYQHAEVEGVSGQQEAFGAQVEYPNDRWFFRWTAAQVQKNFNPTLGRVDRAGIQNTNVNVRYRYRTEGALRFVQTGLEGALLAETDDVLDNAEIGWTAAAENRSGDSVSIEIFRFYERFDDDFEIVSGVIIPAKSYETYRGEISFISSNARIASPGLLLRYGESFDGTRLDVIPSLTLRPVRWLVVSASYERRDLRLPQADFLCSSPTRGSCCNRRPIGSGARSSSGTTRATASASRAAFAGSSARAAS